MPSRTYAAAYHNRAVVHFFRRDYNAAWADVEACRRLGVEPHPGFLAELRKALAAKE